MRTLKFVLALLMLLAALALLRCAMDWRAPFLPHLRPMLFAGLIALSLILILAQFRLRRSVGPARSAAWWLTSIGLAAAVLAAGVTLFLEARFQWFRYHVLHADSQRLERVGHHLMVGYQSLSELQNLVQLKAVSGVFMAGRNVEGKSISQVRTEIDSLQRMRHEQGLPRLWIATDQEGGIVSRLSPPLSRLPALSQIVQSHPDMHQREQAVREFARAQGRELAGIGVNVNFAPVVDVNHQVMNPKDRYTRIFQRAISSDPHIVAQVASWYCATLEETGVAGTLKHFPGLGRVFEDTHSDHANLSTPMDELHKTDWVPFRTLMQQNNTFVMLGHARLAALDPDNPVSMSPAVIAGLLRHAWKYDGVLITDNFSMMAVFLSPKGMDEGSVAALNAGVDLILVSYDPDQYYRVMYALLKADEQGRLDELTLQQSKRRLKHAMMTLSRTRHAGSHGVEAADDKAQH
jgi:beta-N-acetylhexosaminidase